MMSAFVVRMSIRAKPSADPRDAAFAILVEVALLSLAFVERGSFFHCWEGSNA